MSFQMPARPMRRRTGLLLIAGLMVLPSSGCREESAELQSSSRASSATADTQPSKEPQSIGPQFWKYDLDEYDRVDHDVMYGLGGRWISLRFRRKPDAMVDRQTLVTRISTALKGDGWSAESLPNHKYVLSRIWETGPDDLYFGRRARDDEPPHWFFNQAIHVSQDAAIVCIYAEVGW